MMVIRGSGTSLFLKNENLYKETDKFSIKNKNQYQ